ncbi:MAG: cation-translocating P-type ATPase [Clostridium sp.]|uniref:cation-translocating P-type ATPase n=1 Tax=Clostridium sp. TaxID=1506 RepID=UPI0039E92DFA
MTDRINGLTTKEVSTLQEKYGLNELIKNEKPNPLKKFIGVFKEPMFLLLVGASTLYFILGQPREGIVMLAFVISVVSITFIQEWKTEKTMDALKDLTSPQVYTLRNGKKGLIKSSELVPGDIIYIAEGERIPADCQVIEASNFSVDESILTGEAEHVFKVPKELSESSDDYWKKYMLYAGTLSVFGKCTAIVKFTGFNTEYGKIGKAVSEAKDELTPLQKKMGELVKAIAIAGIILCFTVMLLSFFYNGNLLNSILSGITLAMALIPEEFPVVLAIFLSLGAFRLAKKNALMRKVSAVETLGSTNVLCVDKTGTITQNRMKVKKVYVNNELQDSTAFTDKNLSKISILACEKDPYDPMEKAIIENGEKNISLDELYNLELCQKFAFDSKTKRMANIFKLNGSYYVAAKGSPETIIPLCNLSDEEVKKIEEEIDKMASKGLRVLAFAECGNDKLLEKLEEYPLNFKGLVGLQDPPKDGVLEAIKICNNAGIRVVMITGDYSKTAVAIGEEIGLKFASKSITGDEIDYMSEQQLCEAVRSCDVFSRVIPEHKMKIIKALKNNGDIVAMTGDGVNDAPALKNADIGIAMGKRGTEVAKEAAHMILLDDNFTTIVESVRDGRRIFDNIRKAIVYIMIIHIPIAALALFAPLFNLPQILLPMHIMLLELIIDPTCSIIFEGESAEPYIMNQPPRSPKEPLLTKGLTKKVIAQGVTMFLAAFLPFHYLVDSGISVEYARSVSLITLIVANVILVLVNRSNTQYLIHIFKEKENKARLFINSISLVILACIVYIPILQSLFKTSAVDLKMLIVAVFIGILSTGWWELVKMYKNRIQK